MMGVLLFFSCKEDADCLHPELVLEKNAVSLPSGTQTTVKITSGGGIYEVQTDDEDIATATVNKGIVTIDADKVGSTNITVLDKKIAKTQKIKVTVEAIKVTGLKISEETKTLRAGTTLKKGEINKFILTPTIEPANATNKEIEWSSSDETIATVDENGKVKALKEGVVNITATSKDNKEIKAICEVTVNKGFVALTEIVVTPENPNVEEKATLALTATFKPENATDKDVKWESKNPDFATVDAKTGIVTGVKMGKATIVATVTTEEGKIVTKEIEVIILEEPIPVTAIAFTEQTKTINKGNTEKLTPTITPANHTSKITWKSSDENTVKVDKSGNITAVKNGTATITITATNKDGSTKTATISVTVKTPVASVNIAGVNTVEVGKTTTLIATITPADATEKTVTWTSENTNFATIDAKTGVVTGVAKGTATIKATVDGKEATYTVEVKDKIIPVTAIAITPPTNDIFKDDKVTLTATVKPDDATTKTVTWASENTAVATIDATTGEITAVSVGTTKITATATDGSNIKGEITIEVKPTLVTSITVTPATKTLFVGGTSITLTQTSAPANATNKEVTWSSSDDTKATVNPTTGEVTPKAAGDVTITATAKDGSGITGTCTITVKAGYYLPVLDYNIQYQGVVDYENKNQNSTCINLNDGYNPKYTVTNDPLFKEFKYWTWYDFYQGVSMYVKDDVTQAQLDEYNSYLVSQGFENKNGVFYKKGVKVVYIEADKYYYFKTVLTDLPSTELLGQTTTIDKLKEEEAKKFGTANYTAKDNSYVSFTVDKTNTTESIIYRDYFLDTTGKIIQLETDYKNFEYFINIQWDSTAGQSHSTGLRNDFIEFAKEKGYERQNNRDTVYKSKTDEKYIIDKYYFYNATTEKTMIIMYYRKSNYVGVVYF